MYHVAEAGTKGYQDETRRKTDERCPVSSNQFFDTILYMNVIDNFTLSADLAASVTQHERTNIAIIMTSYLPLMAFSG